MTTAALQHFFILHRRWFCVVASVYACAQCVHEWLCWLMLAELFMHMVRSSALQALDSVQAC